MLRYHVEKGAYHNEAVCWQSGVTLEDDNQT